ncbi:LOW QUALITY PROTEIN: uncharacterized protein LOC110186633 [Drosophila serrata]|uniref:LOW QUALITY PROTEIN: uncharacterized protein LOC110186633 n=1 Tax=Drosophila serrata TaxID=7274 RepID=UPI000A1CFEBB|nr:LOW QUALITY PROTEIN: uncharacterized protein LOC110186633 [Drosophila serrata]
MNNECTLQISKHLIVHADLNRLSDKFESAYSLDGVHILPPLMTEIKRLEMQQLRMQALAIEMTLKRSKPAVAEKQIKCLMPRMINAATNTALNENSNTNPKPKSNPVSVSTTTSIAPLVVMGRFRQQLQKSETAIYDHSTKKLITTAPGKTLPILKASHVVIENAPQRAVILPMEKGTMISSLVPKINSNEPLQRSITTTDLRVRPGQERMPGRPVAFSSATQISVASTKTTESKFRSKIPIRRNRTLVLTPNQPPEVPVIAPGHDSSHEPIVLKANSANERRRNYGAKVALKRNEMARKREELAKLKPPPRTNNHQGPKSIITPIKRMEVGESPWSSNFQIPESPKSDNNNQVPKIINRAEGGDSRIPISPKINNNIPKSIRTPIKRVEADFEDLHKSQKENVIQSLDQQPAASKINYSQVPKIIRNPIRRTETGIEVSDILQQLHLFQSLASRQEAEQQRLQTQIEQEQQGLINHLIGQIAQSESKDIASKSQEQ